MKKTINQCLCCSSRRHFLSSFLPAAVAFTVLQSATPAKAEVNQAQALVISCIDFRFLRAEYSFLNNKNLTDKYDLTALAGASLALTGFPHKSDAQAFWDQLDISYKLHHIHKVIIIDHQDCGGYAQDALIEGGLEQEEDIKKHKIFINKLREIVKLKYPDKILKFLYFALDGEVNEISN